MYFGKQMLGGLGDINEDEITCPESMLLGPHMDLLICGFRSAEEAEVVRQELVLSKAIFN